MKILPFFSNPFTNYKSKNRDPSFSKSLSLSLSLSLSICFSLSLSVCLSLPLSIYLFLFSHWKSLENAIANWVKIAGPKTSLVTFERRKSSCDETWRSSILCMYVKSRRTPKLWLAFCDRHFLYSGCVLENTPPKKGSFHIC